MYAIASWWRIVPQRDRSGHKLSNRNRWGGRVRGRSSAKDSAPRGSWRGRSISPAHHPPTKHLPGEYVSPPACAGALQTVLWWGVCGCDGRLDQRASHKKMTTASFVVAATLAPTWLAISRASAYGRVVATNATVGAAVWPGGVRNTPRAVRFARAMLSTPVAGTVATRPAGGRHAVGPGGQGRAQTTPASRPLMRRRTRWEQHERPASGVCPHLADAPASAAVVAVNQGRRGG